MKKIAVLFATLMVVLVSCNSPKTEKPANEQPANDDKPKTVIVKVADLASPKDLFCGMDVEEGNIADTASFSGKLYGFCSSECKDSFMVDPPKYLANKQ